MSSFKPSLLTTAVIAALAAAAPAIAQTPKPDSPASAPTPAAPSAPTSSATAKAAASATATPEAVEQIVVTARRVGELLQDVPLSIRALTGKDLAERGISSISDLSQYTPGLTYSPDFGRTAERPVIRGISALRQEAPQPVSIFIDGVFVRDAALGLAIDDAQRVEVIKGPQSALYGRSTYAGAINYITVKPGNDVSGKVSLTGASDNEQSIFAVLTVPIKADVLSLRARYRHYEFGGQYTNSQSGNKIGQERTEAGGLQVSFKPSANFDTLFSFDTSHDRDGLFNATIRTIPTQAGGVITNQNGTTNIANGSSCNGRTINIVGNNPATGLPDAAFPATAAARLNGWPCGASTFSGTTVRRNEADLANYVDPATGIQYGNIAGLQRFIDRGALTMNYNFDNGAVLTSQTAYTKQLSNLGADQSYNGTRFAPGFGAPAASWLSYNRDKLKYYSQELRLSSSQDQALTWLVGGFFYKEEGEGQGTGVLAQNRALQTVADTMRPTSANSVENFAPFGRVQYEIGKSIRVSAEGRYSEERVKTGGTALGVATTTVGTCVAGQVCFVNGERTFKDFAPRFTIDYKPNAQTLIYGQVAKGSKSGGFNTTPGLSADVFAYNGEKVQSVEIGIKNQLANGRVLLNAALFNNEISGLQLSNLSTVVSPFTGASSTTTIVNNVGKARTRGFETDVVIKPSSWLTLSGNYAYTDAKAKEGTEITNGTVFGGNRSVAGATLPRSPAHSFAASAAVDFPVGNNGLYLFARTDVSYQSRRYAEIQNLIWADAFTRVNANLGVRGGAWRVTAFVKNAGDDDTSLNGFRYLDPATFRRTAVDFLPRLRQYGLTVSYDIK
jgi:iron complex outermembrane recepter protein